MIDILFTGTEKDVVVTHQRVFSKIRRNAIVTFVGVTRFCINKSIKDPAGMQYVHDEHSHHHLSYRRVCIGAIRGLGITRWKHNEPRKKIAENDEN